MQLAQGVWVADASVPGTRSLREAALLVLVGLTGVGKSTTLEGLRAQFRVLPDRRAITDAVIFAGETITDRTERFARTAAYRAAHPGGMAGALERVWLGAGGDVLFDGLRGLEEVKYAADALPNARFVALNAPDEVRVARLLGRADAFDQVASDAVVPDTLEALNAVSGIETVFTPAQRARLAALPHPGAEITAKASIVVSERQHYDPQPVHAFLRTLPKARALLVDTTAHSSLETAERILDWWRAG